MIAKRLVLVALLVTTVLAACGKDEPKPASSGDPATTTTVAETTTTTAAEDAAGEEVNVEFTATEYAYAAGEGGGVPLPAGPVSVVLTNAGAEEHQISIVKLRAGKTQDDFMGLAADTSRFGEVIETWGGPNAVAPGETEITSQVLEPGEYLFVCFIPAPDGVPHVAKGMLTNVTVEGDPATFEAPAPTAAEGTEPLALGDFTFGLGGPEDPTPVAASAQFVVANDGEQPHEAAIYTMPDGTTPEDVVAYFSQAEASGPPPITPAGGIGPIDPGRFAVMSLAPGDYVFICFIPDKADGAPHFAKGMLQFATVT